MSNTKKNNITAFLFVLLLMTSIAFGHPKEDSHLSPNPIAYCSLQDSSQLLHKKKSTVINPLLFWVAGIASVALTLFVLHSTTNSPYYPKPTLRHPPKEE